MSNQWFYTGKDGSQQGPVSQEDLQNKLSSGDATASTLVWTEGMGEWQAVASVASLQTSSTPVSNTPVTTESNPYTAPQSDLTQDSDEPTTTDLKTMLFSFKGRIPRRTYWGYSLAISAIFMVLIFGIMAITIGFNPEASAEPSGTALGIFGIFALILYIPMVWISLALQAKRWHDRNKSAWWLCINLIPYVGGIWAFVENGCLRGTVGNNNYGSDPT